MPSGKPLKGDRVALGRRLGKARKARGLSKAEAARQVGVRVQSWQQWEGGLTSPRPEKLTQIAGTLGIDVMELLEDRRHFFDPVGFHGKAASVLERNYQRVKDNLGPYETHYAALPEEAPMLGMARLPDEVQVHLRRFVVALAEAFDKSDTAAVHRQKKGAA
jgi:transcriptional regulator with XRE-family HTH domain